MVLTEDALLGVAGERDTRRHPGIAATLVTMRELDGKADRGADFATLVAAIRQDYRRRTSLMRALDAKGL